MIPVEHVRLATALVHTVPGAELLLVNAAGREVLVGRRPAADLDPCALRRVVAAAVRSARPAGVEPLVGLRVVTLGGTLQGAGGGVHITSVGARDQRWIASALSHDRVVELLADIGGHAVEADSMRASVRPDVDLGVTVVSLSAADRSGADDFLEEVAAQAAAALIAEELAASLASVPAATAERTGGAS